MSSCTASAFVLCANTLGAPALPCLWLETLVECTAVNVTLNELNVNFRLCTEVFFTLCSASKGTTCMYIQCDNVLFSLSALFCTTLQQLPSQPSQPTVPLLYCFSAAEY